MTMPNALPAGPSRQRRTPGHPNPPMESDMEPVPCDLTISRRDLLKVGAAASVATAAAPPVDGAARGRGAGRCRADGEGLARRERPARTSSSSTRARPCSTRCASTCTSPAPRRAATRASAAHAPCIVDGRRINSCLTLAVMHEGAQGHDDRRPRARRASLHPMQAAFVKHDGYQCGYCTPGQICSAVGDARRDQGAASRATSPPTSPRRRSSSTAELRERMSGNICRCGAYSNIVDAIAEVAGVKRMKPFTYERARTPAEAAAAVARATRTRSSSPAAPTCST